MKFFGNADLQQNLLQSAALETLTFFPGQPVVGQVAFVNSVVYICVEAGTLPVWVPLTREISGYTHNQSSALDTWTVNHNLNTTSVSVQVYDSDNFMMLPVDVQVMTPNTVEITFSAPQVGRAVIITAPFDGALRATYSYTHFQGDASSTWNIVHGLGYLPIVRVFIGSDEVQPQSVTHVDTNNLTINFTAPQAGYARLI